MATELAKAYVQIVPSAKGIKGSISSALGNEADAAGESAGISFGSKMVGMIKGAVAVAAIGKALAASIKEGAALEQSLGGVETLFKENADIVKKYASEAYRTAGLSANEYMETVTGFSASLLQSTGNDTAKAADVANMAITDMSDNANKMGTSMESIQNAYQGFAKQNYTMLDNLKLGYGGTKTEMERLLADAEKLTGIKYDVSNLDDVYSAIHVIQDEMGITGTTAKEAAETLSGSLSSMKSAFKDVLGNLALGADVSPSLKALAKTVTTFLVGNLLPAVWNILRALPGAIVTFIGTAVPQLLSALMEFIKSGITSLLPGMTDTAGETINMFAGGILGNLPQLMQGGREMITKMVEGALTQIPQVITTAFTMLSTFVNNILSQIPVVFELGKDLLLKIVEGIKVAFPQIVSAAAQAILAMVSSIVSHLPQIISTGYDLIVSLIKGIGSAIPKIIETAGEVAASIWDVIKEIDWIQLGKDIISGLINGIGAMAGALWEAATNIARSALDAIKTFLGINSPSRVMRDQIGKFIPEGIAVGIERNTKPITSAMQDLATLTTGTLQTDLVVGLSRNSKLSSLALAGTDVGAGSVNLYQTINTHDSLSESELTREAENFLERSRWKNP